MFCSFLQAGFECSTHKTASGRRLDLIASTYHDRYLRQDYQRLLDIGIRTVREGIRWHLIERQRSRYDFSSVLPMIEAAQRMGIQIIWDVLHFGWPDFLDVFSSDWVDSFAELSARFASLLREKTSTEVFIAPINEISFLSWGGGEDAHIFPFERRRGSEMKRQLVKAAIKATIEIRKELPGVRLVSPEPVIHIVGDPTRPRKTCGLLKNIALPCLRPGICSQAA